MRHTECGEDHAIGTKCRIEFVEEQYGTRPRFPIGHGEPLKTHHFRGQLDDGTKFVYCPMGFLISWSEGDYDHKYCPWCKEFYEVKK